MIGFTRRTAMCMITLQWSLIAHTSHWNTMLTSTVRPVFRSKWSNIYTSVECFTSIHSRIRVFVRTTKSILAFVRVCLYNTREYPTNIRVFDICEYLHSNKYKYLIFASIGWVFVLQPSPAVSDILDLLHKVVIYTVGGPNSQTFMTKYTWETIYLMYRAQYRVQIVRI